FMAWTLSSAYCGTCSYDTGSPPPRGRRRGGLRFRGDDDLETTHFVEQRPPSGLYGDDLAILQDIDRRAMDSSDFASAAGGAAKRTPYSQGEIIIRPRFCFPRSHGFRSSSRGASPELSYTKRQRRPAGG